MSENAAKHSEGTRGKATRRGSGTAGSGTTHGVPQPHFASCSPRILARIPDLDSADSGPTDQTAPAGGNGRMLTSGLSMLILIGLGALVLLAALGLPFLLEGAGPADTESNEDMPSWPPELPAPSASVAPAWQGGAEHESAWQLPDGTPGQYPSDVTVAPPWNESPQPPNWDESSAPSSGSWQSPLPAQPWPSPPAPGGWDNQLPMPVQSLPGAGDPGQMGTPNEFHGTPGMTVPNVPNAQGIGLEAAYPSPAGYDSHLPQNAYQPQQADMNRSMAIGDSLPSGTWSGQSDLRRDPYAMDRAADARANSTVPYRADQSTGYERTRSAAETPWSEYLPTRSPPTSYPGATYPVAGQSGCSDPVAGASADDRRISTYAPTGPSPEATTASRSRALPDGASRQPGVARLHGGIEKPTESNAYDQHRSRLY